MKGIILAGGTGSPSFQPGGKSAPSVTVTPYSPGGSSSEYSPSVIGAVSGLPSAGKNISAALVSGSPW